MQHQQQPPLGCDDHAHGAIDQCGARSLGASLVGLRDRGRAAHFGQSAHSRRRRIGAQHDVRIEHRQQRLEVAAARGRQERIDDLPLAG